MQYTIDQTEEKNKRIGMAVSTVFHVLFFLFLFLSLVTYPDPPPGPAGVLVSFGEPNVGEGDEAPLAAAETPDEVEEEVEEEPAEPEEVKPKPTSKPKKTKVSQSTKSTEVLTDAKSKELAIKKEKDRKKKAAEEAKKKKEQVAKDKAQEEADAKEREEQRKIEAAAEAKRKAAAAKKAAADAAQKKKEADAKALKDQIGSAFGSGSSQGNSGTPGDAGTPDGDPDGKALDGISTGSGEIGGGLSGRKVLTKPVIRDSSQKTGDVVVKVCVGSNGRVVSAKFTQGGSTTSNSKLVATAIAGAKKYKFSTGDIERQCGTIKIKFRVK